MSEWKEYKLGDMAIIVDCEHKTAPIMDYGDFISVRTANILNGKIDFEKSNRVSEETYNEWTKRLVPEEGDIILAREAPVGEVGWISKNRKVCLGQRTVLIRITKNDSIVPKYLLYYMVNGDTKYELTSRSTGSVVEHLNVKDIKNLDLKVHKSIQEQTAIASILSSLDDKIDMLQRQNKTLEQLAETLFRQWFVEETENLTIHELGKIATVGTGKGLKREEFNENGEFPILGANGEIGRTNKFLTDERMILTGRVGTLGKVYINENRVWISDNVLMIKPIERIYFYPIYFSLLRIDFENMNVGSTQPLVTQTDLKKVELSLPSQLRLEEFSDICSLYFDKINKNSTQIRTLTQTRDTLLPKLMSGEVRVFE